MDLGQSVLMFCAYKISIDPLRSTRAGYVVMNINLNIRIVHFLKLINYSLCTKLQDLGVVEILDHSQSRQQWVLVEDYVIEYVRWTEFFYLFLVEMV